MLNRRERFARRYNDDKAKKWPGESVVLNSYAHGDKLLSAAPAIARCLAGLSVFLRRVALFEAPYQTDSLHSFDLIDNSINLRDTNFLSYICDRNSRFA